jgi:hypothetical protein
MLSRPALVRLLPGLCATLAAGSLAAQTTWTRFEERAGAAMAAYGGAVGLFGGVEPQTQQRLGGTFRYENAAWSRVAEAAATEPGISTGHAMAGMPSQGTPTLVLFGGLTSTGATATTWQFTGNNWSGVEPDLQPAARSGHAMVFDSNRNRIVLFGGRLANLTPSAEVWEYDPNALNASQVRSGSWTDITGSVGVGPSARSGHAMAYDPIADQIVVFGSSGAATDTWALRTSGWVPLATSGPGPRLHASMAFNANASLARPYHVVLFGGETTGGVPLGDTWGFDRTTNVWVNVAPVTSPTARSQHVMSVDPASGDVLMLGGRGAGGTAVTGVWRFVVDTWQQTFLDVPRTGTGLAWQESTDSHLLYGGRTVGGSPSTRADTWELRGLSWTQRTPANAPGPRADAGLVHDAARNRTVLFGGRTGSGACDPAVAETWEWDPVNLNWARRFPTTSPPAAAGIQPVYDTARNRIWMLNGALMWSYDGAPTVPIWTSHPQVAAWSGAGAFDSARGRLVVFGGTFGSGEIDLVREWNGSAWSTPSPAGRPPARTKHAMAFDAARGVALVIGGLSSGSAVSDCWGWDGSSWTLLSTSFGSNRYSATACFDPGRGVTVLSGRRGSGNPGKYLVEWDGTTWTDRSPNPMPAGATFEPAMGHDAARGMCVLFGGRGGSLSGSLSPPTNETWTWDGTSMVQRFPSASPPARSGAGMAWDSDGSRLLMFGGRDSTDAPLADPWAWDGTNWTQLSASPAPSPRGNPVVTPAPGGGILVNGGETSTGLAGDLQRYTGGQWTTQYTPPPTARTDYGAAYDRRRDRVVVFGGSAGCNTGPYSDETWEWTGSVWLQRFPANRPSPRARSQLTYDDARARIVLYGGTADGVNALSDTWEWDGTDWLSRAPVQVPPPSFGHALSYDPERRLTMALGANGLWDYGPTLPASAEMEAAFPGCTTALGTPSLAFVPAAGPWTGDVMTVRAALAPAQGFAFLTVSIEQPAISLSLGSLGIPQCTARMPITYWLLMLPQAVGSVQADLAIPGIPAIAGLPIFLQALLTDTGANWSATPAWRTVVGNR